MSEERSQEVPVHVTQTRRIDSKDEPDVPKAWLSLGGSWYVTAQNFSDRLYIHIREYCPTPKRLVPTRKGVGLRLEQWNRLELYKEQIAKEVLRVESGETIRTSWHLGSNWFVTLDSRYPGVSIRKFYLPDGSDQLRPTTKGTFLPFARFHQVACAIATLSLLVPEVADFIPCFMRDDHQNQRGALDCPHCNPNGHTDGSIVSPS